MTIEYETYPDLCPVCGSFGDSPCYAPNGDNVPDHDGRPVAYINTLGSDYIG